MKAWKKLQNSEQWTNPQAKWKKVKEDIKENAIKITEDEKRKANKLTKGLKKIWRPKVGGSPLRTQ